MILIYAISIAIIGGVSDGLRDSRKEVHWSYIGVVDPVDKLMRLFKAYAHGWLFARILFLITGISIVIKEL